jgi:hypothetical protein
MSKESDRRVKTALNETRLLILGVQVPFADERTQDMCCKCLFVPCLTAEQIT